MLPSFTNPIRATIGRSWQIYKICWRVLTLDKELLLFPVMLGLALALTNTGMLAILRIGPGSLTEIFGGRVEVSAQPRAGFGLTHYLILILFHFINYIVIIYFCAALIGAARIRFRGGCPTIFDGFRAANSNLTGIIGWACISAIVSPIYYIIEKISRIRLVPYVRFVAIIMTSLMRGMWSIYTYLVIPALISEGVGPIQAIKRSKGLLRDTWGEKLVSRFRFDLPIIISLMVGLSALVIASWVPFLESSAIAIGVVLIAPPTLVIFALRSIYVAALYEYATTGVIPDAFPSKVIEGNWEPRKVPVFG